MSREYREYFMHYLTDEISCKMHITNKPKNLGSECMILDAVGLGVLEEHTGSAMTESLIRTDVPLTLQTVLH
jgi:hypothetical protein